MMVSLSGRRVFLALIDDIRTRMMMMMTMVMMMMMMMMTMMMMTMMMMMMMVSLSGTRVFLVSLAASPVPTVGAFCHQTGFLFQNCQLAQRSSQKDKYLQILSEETFKYVNFLSFFLFLLQKCQLF